MPLVVFRPTKARLIVEDSRESVLVMKVVLEPGQVVEVATGGALDTLVGVLRIRERRDSPRNGTPVAGTMVFVPAGDNGGEQAPAKYQINVAIAAEKFAMLVKFALAGRMPTKFFVDAGERVSATKSVGLGYGLKSGGRGKVWDNERHPKLPVTSFSLVLPIDIPPPEAPLPDLRDSPTHPGIATNAQVAELVDDLIVFQGETRSSLIALASITALVALAALGLGLFLFYR